MARRDTERYARGRTAQKGRGVKNGKTLDQTMAKSRSKQFKGAGAPPANPETQIPPLTNRLPADRREALKIVPIEVGVARFRLVGLTPLVVQPLSQKARNTLSRTEPKIGKKRELRKPEEEFQACRRFILVNGKKVDAVPGVWAKKAMVSACTYLDGVTKVAARGGFHSNPGHDLIPLIIEKPPVMREDRVTIAMGTPDIRWRAEYFPWALDVEIHYVTSFLSGSDIFNLLSWAGRVSGFGENRPQKGGDWGMFKVELPQE